MLKKKLKKCWKWPIFNIFLTIFNIFSKKCSTYFFQFFLHFWDRQELSKILSFWWKVTFLYGFASREESVTSKKHRIFRIFCMLRFLLWWPNRYGKWLFTIKIKFCLVPSDPKIAKKIEKNMLKKFLKNVENCQKQCWK